MKQFEKLHFPCSELQKLDQTHLRHSTCMYVILSSMSLIQLLKLRIWETRLFNMLRFETPRFRTNNIDCNSTSVDMLLRATIAFLL